MAYFCTVFHETDEGCGYLADPHFMREIADTVRENHAASTSGSGYINLKNYPKEKQYLATRLRQLFYLLLVVFKCKLVLHRPQDNCSNAKKKKPWSRYNHLHLLMPECKSTKPNKVRRWAAVADLISTMKLNASTMEKVTTLSGMVKYLSKAPRTDLGPCLHAEIEHEFQLCQHAMENEPETPKVMFDEFKEGNVEDGCVSKSGQDLLDLIEVIEKYGLRHTRELGQLICKRGKDRNVPLEERLRLLNLYSKSTYATLAKKAFKLIEMQESAMTLKELMEKYEDNLKNRFQDKQDFCTINESINVFNSLMSWNSIDTVQFLDNLWAVLNKEVVKLNTFVLEGPRNAGKSLLLRSLCLIPRFVGEVVLSEGSTGRIVLISRSTSSRNQE